MTTPLSPLSTPGTSFLYPLLFEPALHTKPWGGTHMSARLGKQIVPGEKTGESWEIYYRNTVANGILTGHTLAEVIAADPLGIIGRPNADAEYPLLIKFLDPAEWLSVQVHPDDALAAELEGQPRGKTECWYVIEAEPGATIAFGLAESLTAASMRALIESGDANRIEHMMQYVPVQTGDFVFVQAGTMHALGPGVLIYELQQTSDTTYRVYDWGRVGLDGKPRALHIDQALRCTHFDVLPSAQKRYSMREIATGVRYADLIRSQYFALEKYILSAPHKIVTRGSAQIITAISGHVEIQTTHGGSTQITLLPQGSSAFIPAGLDRFHVTPDGEAEFLIARE